MTPSAWSPAILFLLASAAQADRDRYVIDAPASRFTATVGTTGLLSAFGHDHTVALREFSGEARLSEDDIESGSLQLSIQAASLHEVGKDFSDEDRTAIDKDIHEQALETSKFPQIAFRSTELRARQIADGEYQIDLRGELTLHGVTRQLTVPARVTVRDGTLTAKGEFTVLHSDYKIRRLSAAVGTVKASDEIRMSFEIVARRNGLGPQPK
jgi:polyisoprenoid-binding protein YceI